MRPLKLKVQESRYWRKGKRATAVRVWRPLAKKSTANQRYAISYWWLIVTVAALLTVCDIFSGVEVENRHFRPLYCDCIDPSGRTPSNINIIYALVKINLVGYNSVAGSTGLSSFVLPLLPLKSATSREIPRKFEVIAFQGHPRSSTLEPIESAYATSY